MLTDIHCKEVEELYSTPIVQQTAFWSVVKQKLGDVTLAIDYKSKKSSLYQGTQHDAGILSDLLVILKRIDHRHSIAYVPYGPELEPSEECQGQFLEELSESLRSFLPRHCIMIRYDLCWESYWAKEKDAVSEDETWQGEPSVSTQELRFNINTVNWNFRKAPTNILPADTIYLNLCRDTNDILRSMKPKTRYNIGLSRRKGVWVKQVGPDSLDVWYQLYRETALRNHIYLHDIRYFKTVLSARAENSLSPADVCLLVAGIDNTPLAAMFLVITAHRASYLYGASSSRQRNFMATYALQWEAINIAKTKGCTEYDMFGVAPGPVASHPLFGLYKFKTGFGGHLYHSMGCWDYPLIGEKYQLFTTSELNSQGYHTN